MGSEAINSRRFHTQGKEFFAAAEATAVLSRPPSLPLAFLWGRSIELLLKSYLLSVGVPIKRLSSREFGHNLVALHREASSRGIDSLIGSDPIVPVLTQILNVDYGSKRLEYREGETGYSIPDAEMAERVIRRLIRGINFHLKQNGI